MPFACRVWPRALHVCFWWRTHTVIIKIALTMGRDGDRRIWCRCSMMKKKKKREGTLWAQMVHQVLKKKNRRLAGPAQVAVRNKCRRGIFFFFKEKHTQLTSRDRTSVVASYILLPVLPRCFSFLIWAGLSLCGGMWTFGRGYLLIRETRKSASSTCLQYVHRESTERAPRSIMLRCW